MANVTIAEFAKKHHLPFDFVSDLVGSYEGLPKIEDYAIISDNYDIYNYDSEADLRADIINQSPNAIAAVIIKGKAVKEFKITGTVKSRKVPKFAVVHYTGSMQICSSYKALLNALAIDLRHKLSPDLVIMDGVLVQKPIKVTSVLRLISTYKR